ncbi:MAG: DegT/DnrJ/EryC1/StrS family aminotransferase [Planctomycetota bacterium]|nr:MAG: DegT/DnrJ/EryC1/StrS family aminotransferase [Planctomycetota bacterium]
MNIPLSRPDITQAERDAVIEVLNTPDLSLGPKLAEFERVFAEFTGAKYVTAVNSGTSGLHLCLHAISLGPGDEVITTPFSFSASANCALYEGARPVFADIDPETWNIDPAKIARAVTPKSRVIVPVDVFGQPADLDPILQIANKNNICVIEDSCEALGARYKGKPVGTQADAALFAFYPNKQVTTGEGGIIVTNDENIYKIVVSCRNQGRDEHGGWLGHVRLGFNYRISDINCALGIAQMKRIDEILNSRRQVAEWYTRRINDEKRLRMQKILPHCQISWFVMVVRLNDDYTRDDRDRILKQLKEKGIGCSNYFPPIHLQPFYVEKFGYQRGDFPVCEALSDRTIALPFHGRLTEQEVNTVCKTLADLL